MPPISRLRQAVGRGPFVSLARRPPACLFCIFLRRPQPPPQTRNFVGSRFESTTSRTSDTDATPPPPPSDPRRDLEAALFDLQTHAPNYVNLARVQLALRNLSQPAGHESIRVAFLGLRGTLGVADSGHTAEQLLRLALADPLSPPQEWETELERHDLAQPLVVRVARAEDDQEELVKVVGGEHVVPEIRASSPALNAADLEVLVMRADSLAAAEHVGDAIAVEEAILAPTVEIDTPPQGPTPLATPVHMALLVGDGIPGAAAILATPLLEDTDTIAAAVNFGAIGENDLAGCPLIKVNVTAAEQGLALFREDVGNAMRYQTLWSESNVSQISEWLKSNVLPAEGTSIKRPVRNLVLSLLQNASVAIQKEEARDMALAVSGRISPHALARLNQALSEWAQKAHEELQGRLDDAFASRSWRKLGWWKLFWRADDVGMVSSEMLALHFLPDAERGIIYLAGRVQEAGISEAHSPLYANPSSTDTTAVVAHSELKWPTHITFTRNYLQSKTVPALQALAQKLVLQSASLSGLGTALAGLMYFSSFGLYESGAVAALGVVWSLGALQRRWEAARAFWEGEVREEGRKAVRATEASIASVLDLATQADKDRGEELEELRRVEGIIQRARDALARME
ncbi:hypothetical protein QBC47DRAFT_368807 [Echria macrotheca]|uniref:Mmc1 C-terminal domain-containing protein n=1 Tax=Echria macrotheca TaxID=438768 RepID=A0AAJ0BMH1_9PEZI|nr:hypothetical protein QBC47DRAFT_368807 [Echria macrotheca]